MTKTMLIDATHAEETRVAVVEGNKLVDFDYESKVRKQLKGSVFLAKVTRVEPSLQAAFVNFGGNRHGFLPFSEIHPDYFRIPIADREALLAAQAEELEQLAREEEEAEQQEEQTAENGVDQPAAEDEHEEEDEEEYVTEVGGEDKPMVEAEGEDTAVSMDPAEHSEEDIEDADDESEEHHDEPAGEQPEGEITATGETPNGGEGRRHQGRGRGGRDRGRGRGRNGGGRGGRERSNMDSRRVEMVGGDGVEGDRPFRFNLRRNYKIQEVVKRGQIMLIQVSKEERGNKGAAVTTYLSLPGRYCVLMPNSPRGGGVSRKIDNYADRRKMKDILSDLSVPDGMSVILRTAGVARAQDEIKRDLDYLTRLWDTIREDTLQSSAPALIYEEGNLIKRSIRDLYGRDIEDVHVAGEAGFETARGFMRMLMPSHEKNVRLYNAPVPLFHKWRVEGQISDIGKTTVILKSGGYLVINPTEALISVDVNSGKATKERHIEETAVKTNLEAADEVARQLRLRDLGGLVVIDFIDMEDRRNNRKVENRLRDALSSDRARIQVGRISSFGLLELSRQRLNPSLSEMQFELCPHCEGVGRVPTMDFAAIKALRALEEEGIKGVTGEIALTLPENVAVYILNHKRQMMSDIETRYGFKVLFRTEHGVAPSFLRVDVLRRSAAPAIAEDGDDEHESGPVNETASANENESAPRDDNRPPRREHSGDREGGEGRGRRRGRRGGRGRGRDGERGPRQSGEPHAAGNVAAPEEDPDIDSKINGNVRNDREAVDEMNNEGPQPGNTRGDNNRGGRNRGGRGGRDRGRGDNNNNRRNTPPLMSDPASAPQPDLSAPTLAAPTRSRAVNDGPKEYEVVNQSSGEKKKGWWSRMTE
jgi:ribonuclease E